jgi:hypothetical protein
MEQTATMIGLFRATIPGSSVVGVTSATAVQSLFFTAASVLIVVAMAIFRPRTVSKGSPADETSYCCRIGVNVVFMAAFGVTITAFSDVKQMFSRDQKSACTG